MSRPKLGRRRLRAIRADLIVPGDRLWSSATDRELVVIAASRVRVNPSGNLLDDRASLDDEPQDGRAGVPAVVLLVQAPDGTTDRLGAYALHARLQVIR